MPDDVMLAGLLDELHRDKYLMQALHDLAHAKAGEVGDGLPALAETLVERLTARCDRLEEILDKRDAGGETEAEATGG